MKVNIKKLNDSAVIPVKAHSTDAGFDMVATRREIDDHGNILYGTDLAIEIPDGYVGLLFPRSSVSKKDIVLANSVGVIDSGYRGEIIFKFKPIQQVNKALSKNPNHHYNHRMTGGTDYQVGERIGQLIIIPIPNVELVETDELSDSQRGEGGFGSTGK